MAKKSKQKALNVRLYITGKKVTGLGFVHACRKKGSAMEWGKAAPTDVLNLLATFGLKPSADYIKEINAQR
jgi:hypothetical protein